VRRPGCFDAYDSRLPTGWSVINRCVSFVFKIADAVPVGISIAALVVAAVAARQAKRSADAAVGSERHGERSAQAAEDSAGAARRSADASERSAATQEEALELERHRAAAERFKASEEFAPKWEALSDSSEGLFVLRDGVFAGALRNAGLTGANVHLAVLDLPSGGRMTVSTRREPSGGASGGWESHPHVPPGGVLWLRCEMTSDALSSDARPSIYMDFQATGLAHVGDLGVTLELTREGAAADGALAWKVGRVRAGLRP